MSADRRDRRKELSDFVKNNEDFIKLWKQVNRGALPPTMVSDKSYRIVKIGQGSETLTVPPRSQKIESVAYKLNGLRIYNEKSTDKIAISPELQEVINVTIENGYKKILGGKNIKNAIGLYKGNNRYVKKSFDALFPSKQSSAPRASDQFEPEELSEDEYQSIDDEEEEDLPQAVPISQLNDEYNQVLTVAEGDSQGNNDYEKYESLLINLHSQLGTDFRKSDYDELTGEELVEMIEFLQDKVKTEQAQHIESLSPMLHPSTPTVTTMESLIDPSSSSFPSVEQLLHETVDLRSTPELGPEPTTEIGAAETLKEPVGGPEPVSANTEAPPQIDESKLASSGGSGLPYIERYHKFALKTYFESDTYPKWDPQLEKNVLGSDENEQERVRMMNMVIANYGPVLFIEKRIGSSKEELNELIQLQCCILRNLHLGPRIYQSASVDLSQLNKIKSLASNLNQNQESQSTQVANAQSIENQLSTSSIPVQSEKEYKYEIAYDKYKEIQSRGVADLITKKYEPTEVIITETAQSIAGQTSTIVTKKLLSKKIQSYQELDYDPINKIYS